MNNKNLIRFILFLFLSICPVAGFSQANADKLFNAGQELQKVETVKSQKEAIQKYEAAKVLYATDAKKQLCDNQIAMCNNTIKRLSKKTTKKEDSADPKPSKDSESAAPQIEKRDPVAEISLSQTRLDFKYKPKDNYKPSVEVKCNYPDWSVASKPEWIKVYTSENSISIEVDINEGEEDRSGIIRIVCDEATAELIINQDKAKFASKVVDGGKDLFKKKKNK